MAKSTNPSRYFRSSPEVNRLAAMMYVRFPSWPHDRMTGRSTNAPRSPLTLEAPGVRSNVAKKRAGSDRRTLQGQGGSGGDLAGAVLFETSRPTPPAVL